MNNFLKYILFLIAVFFYSFSFSNPTTLSFPNACLPGEQLTIAAVGDILLHKPLQIKGSKDGFDSLWKSAESYIQQADIAYANLEGPIAEGIKENGTQIKIASNANYNQNNVYSSFPLFNYPPGLALAIKNSGFDIVSTANNHALDRYAIGIDKTIMALDKAGVAHVGTKTRNSEQFQFYVTNKNNFKIAWIACTEHTNGIDDNYGQVLYCYGKKGRPWIINTIQHIKNKVDAIIVTPHWGEQYEHTPNSDQIKFAHEALEAGALAVLGSHPHVLQPLEKYKTKDGRSTFIIYSLGNFVSYQGNTKNRVTIILLLGLTKTAHTTIINGVQIVPMYMENRSGLEKIQLTKIPKNEVHAYDALHQVMPVGNILSTGTLTTNPECH